MIDRTATEVAPDTHEETSPLKLNLKAPWHPLGIFSLLVLLPTFVPFGAFFGAVNYARLGHPDRRLVWSVMGAFVLLLPLLLAVVGATPYFVKTSELMSRLGYASALLASQRPLYDAHMEDGGQSAPVWPLWAGGGIALLAIFILPLVLPASDEKQPQVPRQGIIRRG